MFRIVATGVREALVRLEADVLSSARQALGQAAAYAAELARQTTKFQDQTGNLRGGIHRGQTGTYSLFVKASAKYAYFVENATKPHVIRAKRGKALRFVVGGTTLFRSSVRHPGTKATHFMRDARDTAEVKLTDFVEVGIRHAVSG